jgi:hypothetical protein
MANEFIARNGITSLGNIVVSGSITTTGTVAISGSIASASFAATASSADNLLVRNTLTAQTLVVQTITSSVDFVTGSTRFGSLLANTHIFSGSVTMNPNGLFVSSNGFIGIGTTTVVEGTQAAGSISIFPSSSVSSAPLIQFPGNGRIRPASNGDRLSIDGNSLFLNGTFSGNIVMATGGGNVGIGTSTPTSSLHIYSAATSGSQAQLVISNPTSNTNDAAGIRFNANTAGNTWDVKFQTVRGIDWFQMTNDAGTSVQHSWNGIKYFPGASSLGSSTRTGFISGDGTNVGIATTSPASPLDVFTTRSSGGQVVAITLSDSITGAQTSDGYKAIRSVSNNGASRSEIRFIEDGGTNNDTALGFATQNAANNLFERMRISRFGYITTPYQPAFYAWLPTGTTTTTGNYAGFTSVRLNRGSHYNTGNGRFTAPVAGVYRFLFSALWRQQTGSSSGEISMSVNGSNVNSRGLAYATVNVTNAHVQSVAELLISLNANDYVMPFIYSVGAGSDWYMGDNLAYFCGYLIG